MVASPPRILVMEDDMLLLDIFSRALRRSGYDVQAIPTMMGAHSLLTEQQFDLFLCDIHMGEERGTTLLGELGADLMAQGTQIIVMSAEGQYRDICAEMGIDFYLEKPVIPETLVTFVHRLLGPARPES